MVFWLKLIRWRKLKFLFITITVQQHCAWFAFKLGWSFWTSFNLTSVYKQWIDFLVISHRISHNIKPNFGVHKQKSMAIQAKWKRTHEFQLICGTIHKCIPQWIHNLWLKLFVYTGILYQKFTQFYIQSNKWWWTNIILYKGQPSAQKHFCWSKFQCLRITMKFEHLSLNAVRFPKIRSKMYSYRI